MCGTHKISSNFQEIPSSIHPYHFQSPGRLLWVHTWRHARNAPDPIQGVMIRGRGTDHYTLDGSGAFLDTAKLWPLRILYPSYAFVIEKCMCGFPIRCLNAILYIITNIHWSGVFWRWTVAPQSEAPGWSEGRWGAMCRCSPLPLWSLLDHYKAHWASVSEECA